MIKTINGRDVNLTPTSNEKVSKVIGSEESKSFVISKNTVENNTVLENITKQKEDVNEQSEKN